MARAVVGPGRWLSPAVVPTALPTRSRRRDPPSGLLKPGCPGRPLLVAFRSIALPRPTEPRGYNILIAEGRACVVQPYLPQARGVDSPTLLIRPAAEPGSLYPVFEHVWDALAKRSTPL